uniref:Uncharacterized protein n=1 Tax=Anopheles coluzzii TaxID=1518534 RepID=A0A8W7PG66_ANOCL
MPQNTKYHHHHHHHHDRRSLFGSVRSNRYMYARLLAPLISFRSIGTYFTSSSSCSPSSFFSCCTSLSRASDASFCSSSGSSSSASSSTSQEINFRSDPKNRSSDRMSMMWLRSSGRIFLYDLPRSSGTSEPPPLGRLAVFMYRSNQLEPWASCGAAAAI